MSQPATQAPRRYPLIDELVAVLTPLSEPVSREEIFHALGEETLSKYGVTQVNSLTNYLRRLVASGEAASRPETDDERLVRSGGKPMSGMKAQLYGPTLEVANRTRVTREVVPGYTLEQKLYGTGPYATAQRQGKGKTKKTHRRITGGRLGRVDQPSVVATANKIMEGILQSQHPSRVFTTHELSKFVPDANRTNFQDGVTHLLHHELVKRVAYGQYQVRTHDGPASSKHAKPAQLQPQLQPQATVRPQPTSTLKHLNLALEALDDEITKLSERRDQLADVIREFSH